MQNRLKKLEKLFVNECNSLEEIFEFGGLNSNNGNALTIPQPSEARSTMELEKMKMRDMKTEQTSSFQNLISISVSVCSSLRYLLPPSVAANLMNLKYLYISRCKMIEEIVLKPAEADDAKKYIILPKLSCLKLSHLLNLMSFTKGNYTLDWPSLEEVLFENCPGIQTFCFGHISTPKLEKVNVDKRNHVWEGDLNSTIEYLKAR